MSARETADADSPFRPTEYTAALLRILRQHDDWVDGARVLDIGCGSGALLAAAGSLGAVALAGVDLEADAVFETKRLLRAICLAGSIDVRLGDLFAPFAGDRFDLITANLPHFPMPPRQIGERLPTWSSGGADGRSLLDRFLGGLADHLAPSGRAVVAHNAFAGLGLTQSAVRRVGLDCTVVSTSLVYVEPPKLACMTPAVLQRETGRTIHRYGPHAFGELHIVVIGHGMAADADR